MALADISPREPSRRLDSWKEIAEYLRRDVRTATRWESQGLPLHRVPGGRGRSVHAFTDEIDRWLAGRSDETAATDDAPVVTATDVPSGEPAEPLAVLPPSRRLRHLMIGTAAGLAVIVIGVTSLTGGATTPIDLSTASVSVTGLEVSITDESGASRVVHHFDPATRPAPTHRAHALIVDLDGDAHPEILTATAFSEVIRDRSIRAGELLNLTPSGAIQWRFAFDDTVTFTDATYAGPWVLADWQVEPGASPARVAVSAHDFTWWASIVTVLDPAGKRAGTFVNPGWIETVLWLDRNRLAVSGFNNVRNEAMLALVDPARMDGQGPGSQGTKYACPACPSATPAFYATFARSELNRLTAARFNRASVTVSGTQILATTSETGRANNEASAIYEFDRDLRFVRARYSEGYWDEHRRLEMEGRLTHSRDACPERDGPAGIHLWDAARGWTRITAATGQ